MTSKFVSLAPSPSPKLHACISPYLLNISTWIPNKHLKLDRSNTELLIPPTSLLSQCFSVSDFSIFAAVQAKTLGIICICFLRHL